MVIVVNLDYVRGYFDGDGSIVPQNSYMALVFYSTNMDYLNRIRNFLNTTFNLEGRIYRNKRDSVCLLRYYRKNGVVNLALGLLSGYLHKRENVIKAIRLCGYEGKIPESESKINLDYICGFFDADGSVVFTGRGTVRVAFSNKRISLLSDIKDFLLLDNKMYVMKHNRLPDYQLATEERSRVFTILELLQSGCILKYDAIQKGIIQLNEVFL